MAEAFAFLAALGLAIFAAAAVAVRLHRRSATGGFPPRAEPAPPLSLLKPLKGLEEDLERNLESHFAQRYPGGIEVVFAAVDDRDPAWAIARRVAARFPHVPARFVLADPAFGANPKVATLAAALGAVTHDLCFQSDANARLPDGYLARLVRERAAVGADLVSSLVVGVGERTLGAALENAQLTAHVAPSVCFATVYAGVPCVIGKSMLFRRAQLAAVGGLERVRDVLCEDFVLGRAYTEAGLRVHVATTVIENVNRATTVRAFLARHTRWLKMRAVLHPASFAAEPLGAPTLLAWMSVIASRGDLRYIGFATAITLAKFVLEQANARILRGAAYPVSQLPLGIVREALVVVAWFVATTSRRVVWRGNEIRFGRDTRILSVTPAGPRAEADARAVARSAAT